MSKAYWKLSVHGEFSAAHALRNYGGKCENTHGHNFRVEAVVRGDRLDPDTEITADFSLLKQDLNAVLSGLDHRNLNETPPFDRINPSSENLARHIFRGMALPAEKRGVRLCSVGVWEKETQSAVYCEEE
jgi:6-pyruvoyltetrahydropterin/6-carboxytetrahydropterin synthase